MKQTREAEQARTNTEQNRTGHEAEPGDQQLLVVIGEEIFFVDDEAWVALGRGHDFEFGAWGLRVEVFADADEAAEVAEGIVGEAHLLEVVLPGVGLGAAAEVGFATDAGQRTVGAAAEEALRGDFEAHLFARLPEALGEVVREEERVVAAFAVEQVDALFGAGPGEAEPADVPFAEAESVLSRLLEEEAEKVDTGHEGHLAAHLDGRRRGRA